MMGKYRRSREEGREEIVRKFVRKIVWKIVRKIVRKIVWKFVWKFVRIRLFLTVPAIDVLGIGDGQGEFGGAFRAVKKLGVAHPLITHSADQFLFYRLLAGDVAKTHLVSPGKFPALPGRNSGSGFALELIPLIPSTIQL